MVYHYCFVSRVQSILLQRHNELAVTSNSAFLLAVLHFTYQWRGVNGGGLLQIMQKLWAL